MAVRIRMLGGFGVTVDDVPVPSEAWSRRQAAALVKVLALTAGRRLHREQVLDALWPGLPPETATPRLHKAAHYARRALGSPGAVVLRNDVVLLFPEAEVWVDAAEFERRGAEALSDGASHAATVLELHRGPLLPEDLYEPWAEQAREAVRRRYLDLLRRAGRWEDLVREEPADEQAHLALAQGYADRGDVRAALRQLERLDQVLRHELGSGPSREARALHDRLLQRTPTVPAQGGRLFGRRGVGDLLRSRLEQTEAGRGGTLVLAGPPGVGKSSVLAHAEALARRRGWRTGHGTATAVEGSWPYAPVLEALGDLCRQHPALLDGLGDTYRAEIEKALSGHDVPWSGESGHQRLFVATAELLRLAASGHGLLLVVDDVHEADEASLRLLHYLSRCAVTEPVLVALAHRRPATPALAEMVDSLVTRGSGTRLELAPLSSAATARLVADRFPDLSRAAVEEVSSVSGGLPFLALELARHKLDGQGSGLLPALPADALRTLQRVALLGETFSTDELLAVSGATEEEAYAHLEAGLAAMLVEPCEGGYCFRHALVREALLDQLSAYDASTARREVADRLATLGAAPGRIAHQYLAAGLPSRAVPFVLRAVETAGALGAYRDALALTDAVREHAGPAARPTLLARRGDLMMALGDPEAVTAYQEAVSVTTGTKRRLVRARLARAACFTGDLDTARAALAGLEPVGDEADAPILLARGNVAYFSGDVDTAWLVAGQARDLLQAPEDPWQLVDLVSLQGLIAHRRGEWFDRFRLELRRTQGQERLVTAVFDAHLCVAEYLLYGRVPYHEVIADSEQLRRRATQAGALRAVAFATALIGEAALMMDDLDRAERELEEAVELHREVDATAGEAHSLQRLAQVRLARGDRQEAQRLLHRALPLARWSVIGAHVLPRIYGSMIEASADPVAARAVVDQADATLGENDHCSFCSVMLEVPATIACADVGDLEGARRHLAAATVSTELWETSVWQAAVLEARAHVARAEDRAEGRAEDRAQDRAEGRAGEAGRLLDEAASIYEAAGHHRDAARCRATAASYAGAALV